MKKYLILLLVGVIMSGAFAQPQFAVDKGSLGIAGTASFNSLGDGALGGDRITTLNISPSILYFAMPGFGMGGSFDFSRTSGDFSFNTFGIGPTVAYYFGGKGSRVFPVIRAKYLYGFGESDLAETSSNRFQFSVGSTFMLAKNVGLLTEAFYTYDRESFETKSNVFLGSREETSETNALGIRIGLDIFAF